MKRQIHLWLAAGLASLWLSTSAPTSFLEPEAAPDEGQGLLN